MNVTAVKHNKQVLSRLQLFRNADLNEAALDRLLSQCNYRRILARETLLSPGTENHYLYVILSGRFGIRLGPDDEEIPLTAAEPGECVGEMSFFDSRLPSTQVFASEDSLVLQIEQDILWRMVSSSHEIARNLLYIMSERVRYSNLVLADSFEMQRMYQHFATIDALTGLHNRGWLDDMFDREIRRSERDGLVACLLMIDVDHFKNINDEFGHLAGDRVLATIGESIRKPLRPNDLVARYGGEEFSVLLPETSLPNAVAIAERLRARINEIDPGTINDQQLPGVSVSIGVAEFKPGDSLENLIAAADAAMYEAKHAGRNCVRFAPVA
ncbi:MAG: GGDEF domain-containing protein [Gammaproteobacteria bacterium]|nr:GGDEF domain-containing protein [Gammaproteobacteria bacterium]